MLPSRGRPGLAMLMTVKRELTPLDLLRLATDPTAPRVSAPVLQKLRASHHMAARLLASGKTVRETATIVGYTPQRVSDLREQDPAFRELVAQYQNQITEIDVDEIQEFQGRLKDAARGALEEIQDRLEDDKRRADIPTSELRQIVTMGADRTIAPPKVAQQAQTLPTKITFNMGTRDIRPKTIDQQGNEISDETIVTITKGEDDQGS
jgi:hypothetical protein